jgi:periplasmic protein TonB
VFADDRDSAWDNPSLRRWTSFASFAVEIAMVAGLLLLPLVEPQALPPLRSIESVPVLAVPAGRRSSGLPHRRGPFRTNTVAILLLTARHVPREIPNLDETDVPPPADFLGSNGMEGGSGSGNAGNSLWEGLGTGPGPYSAPANPSSPNQLPRISHRMQDSLIHQVQPAVIDRQGRIENLQVLSGHPMLVEAAMKAVQQWRYRPYFLNEQPVEVETLITVHFTLCGG